MLSKLKERLSDEAYVQALQYKLQMSALALLCVTGAVRAVMGLAGLLLPGFEGFSLSPAPRDSGQHFLYIGMVLFLMTVFNYLAYGFWKAAREGRSNVAVA
jgi:hypothetical protein